MKILKLFNTVHLLIVFNLLLALIAFFKDILLAAYFGTSHIADAVNLAFFLPDTIGNNLIGAALAVSSIPVLTKLSIQKDLSIYQSAIQKLLVWVLGCTLIVMGLLVGLANPLFRLFQKQSEGPTLTVLHYFYLMVPMVIASPFWLLGSSILQASKRFIFPAASPVFYNLFLLLGLLGLQWAKVPEEQGGWIFSLVISAATIIAGVSTWYFVMKKQKIGWDFKGLVKKDGSSHIREMSATFFAYLLILLFGQTALLSERLFASSLEIGTIAALSYAYRISQFPLWVFIAAITTFILPTISAHVIKNDLTSLKRDITKSFFFVVSISGGLSLMLVVFAEPLIKLLLARGAFDSQSVRLTSTILKGYGCSIVGQSLFVFCTRYFVAEGKMKIPLVIGLIGCLLNIALLNTLVPLEGAAGIGYAAAISSTLNGVLILTYFFRKLLLVEQRGEMRYE